MKSQQSGGPAAARGLKIRVYPHKSRVGVDGKYMAWPPLKVLNSMKNTSPWCTATPDGLWKQLVSTRAGAEHKQSTGAMSYYENAWRLAVELKSHIWRTSAGRTSKQDI